MIQKIDIYDMRKFQLYNLIVICDKISVTIFCITEFFYFKKKKVL